ncbi:hypothetical protein [Roseibium sp.]|uniref:hypothetical protein n=1 Tax=Roseibium sp. TaxID=1936156 RepID=UPI0032643C07
MNMHSLPLVLLAFTTSQVASAEMVIVTGTPGTGSWQVAETVEEFLLEHDDLKVGPIQTHGTNSYPEFLEASRRAIENGSDRTIGVSFDRRLDALVGDDTLFGQFGEAQPFENISRHKRISTKNDRVDWVGLGWVRQQPFEPIGDEENDCDPRRDWENKQCAFRSEFEDEFTIRVRLGHTGWPVYGVVGFAPADEDAMNPLVDALASEDWSETARDHFFIVPDDVVRKQRKVTFELWDYSDMNNPLATVSGEAAVPSLKSDKLQSGSRNSCGGQSSACPEFNIPEDVMDSHLKGAGLDQLR